MRRKRNFLAKKRVEKILRNTSLKGIIDVSKRKFNAGIKRGRSNFFLGVRDGFDGNKWNGKKSAKGKLGWGIGRVLRYGKNTSQGILAGINGESLKRPSGFWGKTGYLFGRLISPPVNLVRGGIAGMLGKGYKNQRGFFRKTGYLFGKPINWGLNLLQGGVAGLLGKGYKNQHGFLRKTGYLFGKPINWGVEKTFNLGKRFTTGLQSFFNNERGLRYNSAGRIIGRDGRFVSNKSLNWG